MELTRLKGRLRTAQRGHKLLKDKRDELMKQFMEVVREDLALRQKVEQSLTKAYGSFTVASALMSPEMLEQALLCPKQSVSLETGTENVMSVEVPRYEFKLASEDGGNIYPYGFAQTSGELDDAVRELGDILPDLLRLAEVEKASALENILFLPSASRTSSARDGASTRSNTSKFRRCSKTSSISR